MGMSDARGGEGWWLASDGRWYPPETHASAQESVKRASTSESFPTASSTHETPFYDLSRSPSPSATGWWLASDGRWYPPEQHPDAQATVIPAAVLGVPQQPQVVSYPDRAVPAGWAGQPQGSPPPVVPRTEQGSQPWSGGTRGWGALPPTRKPTYRKPA